MKSITSSPGRRIDRHGSIYNAVDSLRPGLVADSAWPVWQSIDPDAWTPAGIAMLVRELGPVRIGNSSSGSHAFWNVDMGVAAADEASPYGFRPLRRDNETSAAMMPMERFWEPHTVHYYTGSLLEEDGRASLPVLQHGLNELIATIERYPQLPKLRPPIPHLEGDAGRAPLAVIISKSGSEPPAPLPHCITTRSTTFTRSCTAPRTFGSCRRTQRGTSTRESIPSATLHAPARTVAAASLRPPLVASATTASKVQRMWPFGRPLRRADAV